MNDNSNGSDSNGNSENGRAPSALASAVVGSGDAVVAEKLARLAAVLDELAAVDVSLVSDDALVEATIEAERLAVRTAGAVTDRLIVEASDRDLPHGLGFRDIRNFMGQRLHIGDPAARYRVIAATGSFTTICGDRLPPSCPTLAGYVVEGRVAGAHVRAVSRLTADLDPITRARLDTVLDSWAKPGMNNPDDPESPVGPITTANAEQVAAAALRYQRSPAQRNHDAFSALLKQILESGMLGNTHRGLPIQVIVTTSLHE